MAAGAQSASKELASFSDVASLACYPGGEEQLGGMLDQDPKISSYIRVERLDCEYTICTNLNEIYNT